MKYLFFALFVLSLNCKATVEEPTPNAQVCLAFESGTSTLDGPSKKRLATFLLFSFKRNAPFPVSKEFSVNINGSTQPTNSTMPPMRSIQLALERERFLMERILGEAGTTLKSASSSTQSERSKYIAEWRREKHIVICDAVVNAYFEFGDKPALCGKTFGRCSHVCSESICELDP